MNSLNKPKKRKFTRINYRQEKAYMKEFLQKFEDFSEESHEVFGHFKYLGQMARIANQELTDLEIHLEDLEEYFTDEAHKPFKANIRKNTRRYIALAAEAADELIRERNIERTKPLDEDEKFKDNLNNQRMETFKSRLTKTNESGPTEGGNNNALGKDNKFIYELTRKFNVKIIPGNKGKRREIPLRQLKSNNIGQLVSVRAKVVKASVVKPQVKVISYICESCGYEIYQTVKSKTFLPRTECPGHCAKHGVKGRLTTNYAVSKFVPYQELKIQETIDQTPVGSIPRTFNVKVTGDLVRKCMAGDVVKLDGIFMTEGGGRGLPTRESLIHETIIEALKIDVEKKKFKEYKIDPQMIAEMKKVAGSEGNIDKLARSICPEVWGMEDVKKALLLLIVGGSELNLDDGMKIRGDINVALVGDPGVAKSQLLKHIAHLTPRSVYTTGKGASGAGLTASVTKDPVTGEISLESGALVLADKGICCIDEFDKMDERDRASIHEVMEQQTISIAKAGVSAILNARTSILAAANPVYNSRYDKSKTPHENINLPESLLSRFDLIFILLDTPSKENDGKLADHITYVHQNRKHKPKDEEGTFDTEFLKNYIAFSREFNPVVPSHLHEFITREYVKKRKFESNYKSDKTKYAYTTPRTLLGIIRLAQGLAKLRFSTEVGQDDILEAMRLMDSAQKSLKSEGDADECKISGSGRRTDKASKIYNVFKSMCGEKNQTSLTELQNEVVSRGITVADLEKALERYSSLGMIVYSKDNDFVKMI